MNPQIHLKRTACPLSRRRMGWAWTVITAQGQTARGWHGGTREEAGRCADAAMSRLNKISRTGGRARGYRSAEAALLRPEGKA